MWRRGGRVIMFRFGEIFGATRNTNDGTLEKKPLFHFISFHFIPKKTTPSLTPTVSAFYLLTSPTHNNPLTKTQKTPSAAQLQQQQHHQQPHPALLNQKGKPFSSTMQSPKPASLEPAVFVTRPRMAETIEIARVRECVYISIWHSIASQSQKENPPPP